MNNRLSRNVTNIVTRDYLDEGISLLYSYKDLIEKVYSIEKSLNRSTVRKAILSTLSFKERPVHLKLEPIINILERKKQKKINEVDLEDIKSSIYSFQDDLSIHFENEITLNSLEIFTLYLKFIYSDESIKTRQLNINALLDNNYLVLKIFNQGDVYGLLDLKSSSIENSEIKKLESNQFFFFYNFLEFGEESNYAESRDKSVPSLALKADFLVEEFTCWNQQNILERNSKTEPKETMNKMWDKFKKQLLDWNSSFAICQETGSESEKTYHLLISKKNCLNKVPSIKPIINRKKNTHKKITVLKDLT